MLFLWVTVAVFVITIVIMPKRITWMEMYSTGWFAIAFACLVDTYLDRKLNLYGFFNKGVIDWETLIIYFGMYPLYNAIFLNFFPSSNLWKKILYILGNDVVLMCYEWGTVQAGVLFYRNWSLVYSAFTYPLILFILYWNWRITKRLLAKGRTCK